MSEEFIAKFVNSKIMTEGGNATSIDELIGEGTQILKNHIRLKHLWAFEQSDALTIPRDMKLKVIAIEQGGIEDVYVNSSKPIYVGSGGGCAVDIREYKAGDIITMTISSSSTLAFCEERELNIIANVGTSIGGGTATGGNIGNYTGGKGGKIATGYSPGSTDGEDSLGCGGGCYYGHKSGNGGISGGNGLLEDKQQSISGGGNGGHGGIFGGNGGFRTGNGGHGGIFGGNGGNGQNGISSNLPGNRGGDGGHGGIFGGNGGNAGNAGGTSANGGNGGDGGHGNLEKGRVGDTYSGRVGGKGGKGGTGLIFGYIYTSSILSLVNKNFGGGNYIAGVQGLPLVWIEEVE